MATLYQTGNPPKDQQTASPDKYPQGYFKDKPCRLCGSIFTPKAPSECYCSEECRHSANTNAYLKRTYGITYDDYVSMLKAQGGNCKICGDEGFVMDKDRHKLKLVVDHNHATGEVRGLLCHNCNRALGLFHDSIKTLTTAIEYLEGATTIPEGSTLEA